MMVTEVHIDLPAAGDNPRVLAYCGLVLDGEFAVHDVRLIRGNSGMMLSMPSRWKRHHCPFCRHLLNDPRACYCSNCGRSLPHPDSNLVERVDVFHPLNNGARLHLQEEVVWAYQDCTKSKLVSGG